LNESAARCVIYNVKRMVETEWAVMWRGGGLHVHPAAGACPLPQPHAHFGVQLSFGFEEDVTFAPGRWARGWLIGSDRRHAMYGRGAEATMVLDPLTADGRRAVARIGKQGVVALDAEECAALQAEIERAWERGGTGEEACAAAGRIARLLASRAAGAPPPIDRRVEAAVRALIEDPSGNVSLADLAARVSLSESRLAHLFRRDVGVPMRQYRLSLRMVDAVRLISRGSSLTEAAHMAGFSDSAHFCRISRRMFGSAPSDLPDFDTRAMGTPGVRVT
jgi:AraC family transcriptional regulator